ncbi:MAG: hypothetical protein RLZZ09_2361 [Pseudomonadota bacterium]
MIKGLADGIPVDIPTVTDTHDQNHHRAIFHAGNDAVVVDPVFPQGSQLGGFQRPAHAALIFQRPTVLTRLWPVVSTRELLTRLNASSCAVPQPDAHIHLALMNVKFFSYLTKLIAGTDLSLTGRFVLGVWYKP